MPEPVDIYLDTYHLHSLTERLPTTVHQPLQGLDAPTIRVSGYNNPGAHGETISNALYGGRQVTLEGRIRGDDVSTYRANRQAFHQAVSLQTDASGFPLERILTLNLGDGKTYRLPVIVTKLSNPEHLPTSSPYQLELTATRWYLEVDSLLSAAVGLPQPGGASFPWAFPLSFSGGGGGSVIVTNNGSAVAYPTITLTGPVIAPVISNSTTGQKLQLNITLLTGDELVISTRDRTITQGGTTNKIGTLMSGSTFWGLVPGENLITYAANQFDASQADLFWRDAVGGL